MCIMKQMGWVDEQGEVNKQVMMKDMATLNSAVTDAIDMKDIDQCVNKTMKKMARHPIYKKSV